MSQISFFRDIKNKSVPFKIDVNEALKWIKEGKYRDQVDAVRYEASDSIRVNLKKNLPLFCFSGVFSTRSIAGLEEHSGFICLDFDKFKSREELAICRNKLADLDFVFAIFDSPTGGGLKALVKIPKEAGKHALYFESLAIYFQDYPEFDKATKDVSRACFVSYDENLYHNPESEIWTRYEEPDLHDLGTEDVVVPLITTSAIMDRLVKWWQKRYGSEKGSRNNNCYILASAFCEFGITKQDAQHFMSQFKDTDFSQKEIQSIINSAYSGKKSVAGSKFFEDEELRGRLEKDIINGKTIDVLKRNYRDLIKDVDSAVDKLSKNIAIDQFWEINKKSGKIEILPHKFKKYLAGKHIYKYMPDQSGVPIFVQIDENKVQVISVEKIKDIVLYDLENREGIGYKPYDFMAKSTKFFTDSFLTLVDTIEITLLKDTKDEAYIYYKDAVVRITKDSIDKIEYIDLDGFVWANQILDREFNQTDYSNAVFKRFIYKVSGGKDETYRSICSTIGYLLHSYQTRGNNYAVILNDETISDNPNGRSGKGLFTQGIERIKRTSIIDGKSYDPKKSFQLQTVTPETQILVFDDLKKNFPFELLFSFITEGVTIEKKNKDAIKLSIYDSPKVLISTNYTIGGTGGSFDARKHELEFSSYFNSKHTPKMEFGHTFFDDWSAEEFSRFDSFMMSCLQGYLATGLIVCPQVNLEYRKFIRDTNNHEFVDWAIDGGIMPNVSYSVADIVERFALDSRQKPIGSSLMGKWVSIFADYKGYKRIDTRLSGQRSFILKDENSPMSDIIRTQLESPEDLPF